MRDSKPSWQKILAQGFNSAAELLSFLQLPPELGSTVAEQQFKTRVPRRFAGLMERGNPADPLLLQVLAQAQETEAHAGFVKDPLQERDTNPVAGLIHKYDGRVLLTLSSACAINCRYCFRRHFPYEENNPGQHGWQQALEYIANNDSIFEIILSGGDPLLVKNPMLQIFLDKLAAVSHVRILRIHSRVPIVLPERIDADFIDLLAASRLQKVIVVHSNHPNELDEHVAQACFALKRAGCHLLNQSVLLAGVNDDAATLAKLSKRLFEIGILPYYLHLLDKVEGAAHFDTPSQVAETTFKELQAQLPGYLVPRLTREVAGERNKILVNIS
ncbi:MULTISPECIES: EF-P beta-lysylation protein EpmB [Legionella]|uniref:L-lysine 2,3-aminomutase n=1 Tax=Legionella septentrionalis TaxID=2498109 RepID=A0A3S0WZ69_9GAMM|nr:MULTISPECIES: EF-P beta-lysylation protein EpmB [Legionella]MCP0913784.1 EF-P beta-lysylation protein EpmB [Legionella sp. 27cVA30]RUQ81584.1 EF-P beta-lysylation protein EpmB [Legionella septentrionalis]RUQ96436.1 EF-P beta-lysylation protein EpmB [Legionella septentrionalis]RUR09681.1 EF-P beta-lysylation protein EpmB [Legionella septentrionalis]RUR14517.1 EF-P beta-lysylation protein EpmB [Legionella septentrionalis]